MRAERVLRTLLFNDIVGSTPKAAALGDRRWRELLRRYHDLARREIDRHQGRAMGTAGDGLLALFDHPAAAIRCACVIRDAARRWDLEVRSGVHTAEVELSGNELTGIAVHTGSRIMDAAGPGEVVVSGTVQGLVWGSGFEFEDRGSHALRGVPGEWRLFAVTSCEAEPPRPALLERVRELVFATSPRAARQRTAVGVIGLSGLAVLGGLFVLRPSPSRSGDNPTASARGAAPAIAVLPFDVSGPGLEQWRESLVHLLSTNLDGIGGLRSIDSRTVLARWQEAVGAGPEPPDKLDVARLTGARYAILGSAASLGSDIRLRVQVHDLASGERLAVKQVDGAPNDLLGLVDRLSIEVLAAIPAVERGTAPRMGLAGLTTSSLKAVEAYLEGEELLRRADIEGAVAAYSRAVDADSTFPLALYRLADLYPQQRRHDMAIADEYRRRAAATSDRLPEREALLDQAAAAMTYRPRRGVELLRQAALRYPDDAEAWYRLGVVCAERKNGETLIRLAECDRALTKAVRLDPRFGLAHEALLDHVFVYSPDRARVSQLIAAHGKLGLDTGKHRWVQLASALAFGDSAAQNRAMATVADLELDRRELVADYLRHPRFRALEERVVLAGLESADSRPPALTIRLFFNGFLRGRTASAFKSLDTAVSSIEESALRGWREEALYIAHARGMPVPTELLERYLHAGSTDSGSASIPFYRAAYALDLGDSAGFKTTAARLREQVDGHLANGDSVDARYADALLQALEGYALWKSGDGEEAARILMAAQERAMGDSRLAGSIRNGIVDANGLIRFWLGTLLLELDRPRDAERYFASMWQDALAAYHLGTVYEALGDQGRARAAFSVFATAWRDADPELQPLVERGRAFVSRLATTESRTDSR